MENFRESFDIFLLPSIFSVMLLGIHTTFEVILQFFLFLPYFPCFVFLLSFRDISSTYLSTIKLFLLFFNLQKFFLIL